MMPDRILNNPIADYLGGATFIASISLKSMEWFNLANINDILTTISILGGLVWMVFKIKNARLDSKLKEKELKK